MSIIKSFSVGDGDMFYIKHGSDNFSIIDCCLGDDNKEYIVDELEAESRDKNVIRFISTHPDDDHIAGLAYLDSRMRLCNFYCVKNDATKKDGTIDFQKYCELRDSEEKSFYLNKGCTRKWMNKTDDERRSSCINILWPITTNSEFQKALKNANEGKSPNNISPIIKYSTGNISFLWMGDMEKSFMESIKDDLNISKVSILFAPHHGRESGKVPSDILEQLDPKIIIIGEAPSENLNYYRGYNTITQNSAGDIVFDCQENKIHISVSNENYEVGFLDYDIDCLGNYIDNYIGTLEC